MPRDAATIRHRTGAALAILAAIAAAWTVVVLLSGGIDVGGRGWRVIARDPLRPLGAAVALGAIAWMLLGAREGRRRLEAIAGGRERAFPRLAGGVALATLIVSIAWNTRAVGGSDSSCYALQAEAFAHGRVTLAPPLPFAPSLVPPVALAPTGFVPGAVAPHDAVPICAPGLAVLMAPAWLVHREAVFLVVPLFAALAVWCTFVLGRALHGEVAGVCAAVLLACSPIFLYQSVQPMSDVPAAALWLAALVVLRPDAPRDSRAAREIAAGLCASTAVLMRPNVALIVLPLLALLPSVRAWLRFGAASLPALAAMIALNVARYGAPFASGYGDTGVLFAIDHVVPNLLRYPRWLLETHTPFIALAAIAPVLPWPRAQRRFVLVAAAAGVLTIATYLAYTVFDDWWYIRFLLPALPVLLVFSVVVVCRLAERLLRARGPVTRVLPVALAIACLSVWLVMTARSRSVFDLARLESRFRLAGEQAGRALPASAIVLAVQQSGSVRYYGRRPTLAWDGIPPERLDAVVSALIAAGHPVFLVLEDDEVARFRARFAGQRAGALDGPPILELRAPGRVRFFAAAAP